MRPFGSQKNQKTNTNFANEDETSDDNDDEVEDPNDQIQAFRRQVAGSEDEENDGDHSDDDATLAANLIDEGEVELESTDVHDLSDESEDDDYTSQSCKKTLTKLTSIVRCSEAM
ncbi:hypothetical protein PTTG_01740 [Puccinia triticina 1-1 BBBD Race 1]|uniref:Uncharacterized protein n=1 Tax=Puccinia triticina (isolate 1-1 / race 1 (BBBD)) TaxID=630390 RepID=A0A0C4ELV3_PUCT1|nr:hypothetical protein PTTG_01740 [Puccinia triticina 1-1 BBBD Race 1]